MIQIESKYILKHTSLSLNTHSETTSSQRCFYLAQQLQFRNCNWSFSNLANENYKGEDNYSKLGFRIFNCFFFVLCLQLQSLSKMYLTSMKTWVFIFIGGRLFTEGMEECYITSTAWYYIDSFGETKQFLGVVLAAYSIACMVTAPLTGRLADRFGYIKCIIIFCQLMKFCGYVVYSISLSPYFPLFGRFISGIGNGAAGILFGQLALYTREKYRVQLVIFLEALYTTGTVFGAAFSNFMTFNRSILGWQIDAGNSPGIVLAVVSFVMLVLSLFLPSQLGDEILDDGPLLISCHNERDFPADNDEDDHRPARSPRDDSSTRHHSPARSSRDVSPARSSRDISPARSSRDVYPARSSRDISPVRSSGDVYPARSSRDNSPARSSRDNSPARSSRDDSSARHHSRSTVTCLFFLLFLTVSYSTSTNFNSPLLAHKQLHLPFVYVKWLFTVSSMFSLVLFLSLYIASEYFDERKLLFLLMFMQIPVIAILSYFAYSWESVSKIGDGYILIVYICLGSPAYFSFSLISPLMSKITDPRKTAFYQGLCVATWQIGFMISRICSGFAFAFAKMSMLFFCLGLAASWLVGAVWFARVYFKLSFLQKAKS